MKGDESQSGEDESPMCCLMGHLQTETADKKIAYAAGRRWVQTIALISQTTGLAIERAVESESTELEQGKDKEAVKGLVRDRKGQPEQEWGKCGVVWLVWRRELFGMLVVDVGY
jgi:hypothetical protein